MLFIASSRVDYHEQAHEETHAQATEAASIDSKTREEKDPRRSSIPVSEKNPGSGIAIGSPDTHRSHSVADDSPPAK